jgi:Flp pilus assembly protein TadB
VPGWLRSSLIIAAVVGGALLLWVGFAVLVAILLIAALPFWLWSLGKRRRAPQGPVTLEGAATRVDESVVLTPPASDEKARDGAPEKN